MSYYCSKCKRKHYRGKIYSKHLKYNIKEKKDDDLPSKKFINPPPYLRFIAKKQIITLMKKWLVDKNDMYRYEINRILRDEKSRNF